MLREAAQISSSQCSAPNDGIALTQTVEGAMDEMTTMLQRIRTLSVQAANGTNTSSDRASIQAEVTALSQEITRIACRTTFGGKKVLSGFGTTESLMTATTGKINFQVGSNHDDLQTLDMNIYNDGRTGKAENNMFKEAKNIKSGAAKYTGDTDPKFVADKAAYDTAKAALTEPQKPTDYDTHASAGNKDAADTAYDTAKQAYDDALDALGAEPKATDKYTDDDEKAAKAEAATTAKGYSLENLMKAAGITDTNASFQVDKAGVKSTSGDYTVFNVSTSTAAQATLASIDKVINLIDTKRGDFGALENRMSSTISNQTNIMNNESDARSRIRDTDYAEEASNLSAQSIVQQAASSMLTQANSLPQMALSLLG